MRTLLLFALLAGLSAGCATPPRPGPASYRVPDNRLGDRAMDAGQLEEAISHYDVWLASHPDDFDATYRRAVCLERSGDSDGAAEGLGRALTLRPDDLSTRLRLATVLYGADQADAAESELTTVLTAEGFADLPPGTAVVAHGLAAQIALGSGDTRLGLDHLDRAIGLAERHRHQVPMRRLAALRYNRSMGLFGLGAYQMALEDYEAYALLREQDGQAPESDDTYHLALLSYLAGRFDRARSLLPELSAADRRALASKLADPGFFLSEVEIRMAAAEDKR